MAIGVALEVLQYMLNITLLISIHQRVARSPRNWIGGTNVSLQLPEESCKGLEITFRFIESKGWRCTKVQHDDLLAPKNDGNHRVP